MVADMLSDTLACTVIQTIGQSTVDYYSLSIHEGGRIIRKITCNEYTIGVEKEGKALLFEELLSQDDEEYPFFDYENMDEYCLHFGFDLLTDPSENDGEWTIIQVKE